jgi:hypothetical protein
MESNAGNAAAEPGQQLSARIEPLCHGGISLQALTEMLLPIIALTTPGFNAQVHGKLLYRDGKYAIIFHEPGYAAHFLGEGRPEGL